MLFTRAASTFSPIGFFALLLAIAVTATAPPQTIAFTNADRTPNIVFIFADDLGYGDLGCYGQKVIRTVNIDRLADEGMKFTQFYAGSTVCAPSRNTLMTGQHTGHTRVRGNARVPLRPEDVTVAELLQKAGYKTGLIGKWGLGEPETTGIPTKQGFDYFFGYLNQGHAHNYYPDYLWRKTEKVLYPDNVQLTRGVAKDKVIYSHDELMKEAHRFIARHRDNPFFLYLSVTIPHANNEAGRELKDGMEVPSYGEYADRDWPNPQKGHAAMISYLDVSVGQVVKQLDQLGLDENTIIFFTSDNGPHREGGADPKFFKSAGPLRGMKRDLTEGGIRVPMIVRWPGKIQPGSVTDHICALWDFLPTATDLAGVEAPKGIDGISFLPTLLDKPDQPDHEYLYWEFHERGFDQAIRRGDWKGIRHGLKEPLKLYNLAEDIGENDDIAAKHPQIVSELEKLLDSARTESENWPIRERKR